MTDGPLMEGKCVHGQTWYDCATCGREMAELLGRQERETAELVREPIGMGLRHDETRGGSSGAGDSDVSALTVLHGAVLLFLVESHRSLMLDDADDTLRVLGSVVGLVRAGQAVLDLVTTCSCGHQRSEHWRGTGNCMAAGGEGSWETPGAAFACACAEFSPGPGAVGPGA